MKVALGQFAVSRESQDNADTCIHLMQQADAACGRARVAGRHSCPGHCGS